MTQPLKLGVSTCLLGKNVRYDGGHKLDRYITDTLGQFVEFVPVCPEVECGLSIPRESMRLVGSVHSPRLIAPRSGTDHTERMQTWAKKRLRDLAGKKLCGFVFKANSPSSGMERVRVYNDKGMPQKNGVGVFARAFMDAFPMLPVEEDGRLNDPRLRENFIEKIFVMHRWYELMAKKRSISALMEFHKQHKLIIMSHQPKYVSQLGATLANTQKAKLDDTYEQYFQTLMQALHYKTTVKKNTNVLDHAMGYFKKDLSKDEKQELKEIITAYHRNLIPLIVPITLLNHFVRKYGKDYLVSQWYLNPHPMELKLRNHV